MSLTLENYKKVQGICKKVLTEMQLQIKAGMSEADIKNACEALIRTHDVHEFWYHNVPVIVAVGEHTAMSMSGKDYVASDKIVNTNDLVTIDLSLAIENHWGIYAKSYVIENGVTKVTHFDNVEFQQLQQAATILHKHLVEIVHPDMTFHQLFHAVKEKLTECGVQHLDFRNNFGHSIETNLNDRVYIENNCHEKLGSKKLFGFEPHLKFKHSQYGFKEADIYYFDSHKVRRLSNG